MSIYIDIHTHSTHIGNNISIFNITLADVLNNTFTTNSNQYYSIGIHPSDIELYSTEDILTVIEKLAFQPNILAIGEAGLDIFSSTKKDVQKDIFIKQIRLSETYKKPLIIHCVRCFEELIHIKKTLKPTMPWIIHGYNANRQIFNELQKHNCFVSFGKNILFPNSNATAILKDISAYPFFLESDNSSFTIEQIYNRAGEILNKDVNILQNEIHANFNLLFQ